VTCPKTTFTFHKAEIFFVSFCPRRLCLKSHPTRWSLPDLNSCCAPFGSYKETVASNVSAGDYAGFPGCGLLRLHSTYRHDLKIYASDEGRVQMTAAAFAKVKNRRELLLRGFFCIDRKQSARGPCTTEVSKLFCHGAPHTLLRNSSTAGHHT